MRDAWWRGAVVYQTYLRSFADASGDGIGDLAGLRSRIPYLRSLGVDAIWINPCYPSPQRDHGYDVADYFGIDPAYGDETDFRALVDEAHASGIRVLMDMVANHCSTEHAWFREAVAAGPESEARRRFLFRDGTGENGELPPNNWRSVFGGTAWTRVDEPDGTPGQWYLHSFDAGQPDFDWRHPEVPAYFEDVLRHWFDLGADGFRIDVAHGMFKRAGLPDHTGAADAHNGAMWNQPEVHDVYRRWREIADSYTPRRYLVGEVWVPDMSELSAYIGPDQLHQAFCFDLLVQPWDASAMRAAIDRGIQQGIAADEPPAWALSNHDVHRTVTRYGQQQDLTPPHAADMIAAARRRGEVDVALGERRARAAAMLELALPGTVYLYQGEELGLPEVFDLAPEDRQDPIWTRSGGAELGRDGCRVPLPWTDARPSFGFSDSDEAERPWLPQPDDFGALAASRQETEPASTLQLFRRAIHERRAVFPPDAPLVWVEAPASTLAFRRGTGLCIVNFGDDPVALPSLLETAEVIARSAPDASPRSLPGNSAIWLQLAAHPQLSPDDRGSGLPDPDPLLVPTAS